MPITDAQWELISRDSTTKIADHEITCPVTDATSFKTYGYDPQEVSTLFSTLVKLMSNNQEVIYDNMGKPSKIRGGYTIVFTAGYSRKDKCPLGFNDGPWLMIDELHCSWPPTLTRNATNVKIMLQGSALRIKDIARKNIVYYEQWEEEQFNNQSVNHLTLLIDSKRRMLDVLLNAREEMVKARTKFNNLCKKSDESGHGDIDQLQETIAHWINKQKKIQDQLDFERNKAKCFSALAAKIIELEN